MSELEFPPEFSMIARCPQRSIDPSHYRDDGSCRCHEHKLCADPTCSKAAHCAECGAWL